MTLEPTYRLDAPDHGPTFDNIVLTWNQAALDTIRQGSIVAPAISPLSNARFSGYSALAFKMHASRLNKITIPATFL